MAETVRAINPRAEVTLHARIPAEEELPAIIGGADIVIPAVDEPVRKAAIGNRPLCNVCFQ
jgi:tRNA A37 threonylcarbamoyladenosine dehydratase